MVSVSPHQPALKAFQLFSFEDSVLLQYSIMSQGNWIPMVSRSLKEMNAVYSFQMSGLSTTLCRVPEQSLLLQKPQHLCVLSFSCLAVLTSTDCEPFASTVGWGFLLHYFSCTDSYMARVCCLFFRVVWEASALIVYFRIIIVQICCNTFQLQWLLWKWLWLSEKVFTLIIVCDWNTVLNFALMWFPDKELTSCDT